MYESFFGFHQRPYAAVPEPERYFPAEAAENARQTLARTIERAEGIGLLIGPSGTGKTLLCHVLATQFRDRFQVALLANGRIGTRKALLQAILFELGLPYRGLEYGELRLTLIDHLAPRGPAHNGAADVGLVLLIDEAHTLSLRLLEELRTITDLVRDGQPRVRLVLAGGPQLDERFTNPKLESFSQRVAARCYLHPLSKQETCEFVQTAIEASGGKPGDVFSSDALEAIYLATDGVPRLINQLCDHALFLASAGQWRQIDRAATEDAWANLQQLPAAWNRSTEATSAEESIIEFGRLDEPATLEIAEGQSPSVPFRPTLAAASVEPAEQLEAIQQQLGSLEHDFEPAGSIAPQIELVFAADADPFGELFMQEEVIVDRYSMLDRSPLAKRPVVSSREGTELGEMLAPYVQSPPKSKATATATAPAATLTTPAKLSRPSRKSELAAQAATAAKPAPRALPAPVVPLAEPNEMPKNLVHHINDDDLIVVETNPHDTEEPAAPMPRQVRRQEYRQLFARLRRG